MSLKIVSLALGYLSSAGAMTPTVDPTCEWPGVCVPPSTQYSWTAPVTPRRMWIQGADYYAGAASVQTIGMSYGAYVSQDIIRRNTPKAGGGENGDPGDGYELTPQNIMAGLDALYFTNDSFHELDAVTPQAWAYLGWLKQQLANGWPVVQFVLLKGYQNNSRRYRLGHYDHVVPVYGIYSNHPLNDPAVYSDDYILSSSNYKNDGMRNLGYYRSMPDLVDTLQMTGACRFAREANGAEEFAYPCIDEMNDYGVAMKGLRDPLGLLYPVSISSAVTAEPNIRNKETPVAMNFQITVSGLTVGSKYELKKFTNQEWPHNSAFATTKTAADQSITFIASETSRTFHEAIMGNAPSMSNESAYFAAFKIDLHDPRPTVDEQ